MSRHAWMGFWLVFAAGCFGDPAPESRTEQLDEGTRFGAEWLDRTWVVEVATEEGLAPFASEPGWVSLVMKRDLREAVQQLGHRGGLAAARAHVDAAALFRQAALVAGHSFVEVYGRTPNPTDPAGAAHLAAVGYALRAEWALASTASLQVRQVLGDPTRPWHAPWQTTLDQADGQGWPPTLETLPLELPPRKVGRWPVVDPTQHYTLADRTPGIPARRPMGDPSALVALAQWHDAVAAEAAGEALPLLQAYRVGDRWPADADVAAAGPSPLALRFGSDLLVPEDADFLVALHGTQGAAAVAAHSDRSLLAWIAAEAQGAQSLEPELAEDLVQDLRDDLVRRSRGRTEGQTQAHHRQFADIAMVGTLRSLAQVAEVQGDQEAAGKLRISAWERSRGATADPVGLLSFAAWDARNRYPLRALDILHAQTKRYPSLEVARYGLDVLGLRVGQERSGELPGL